MTRTRDDKDEDDDEYDTHPTSDWLTMKMTMTLEDQTTTDPTWKAWRTTIRTTMDQMTEEVLMSTDLVKIKV